VSASRLAIEIFGLHEYSHNDTEAIRPRPDIRHAGRRKESLQLRVSQSGLSWGGDQNLVPTCDVCEGNATRPQSANLGQYALVAPYLHDIAQGREFLRNVALQFPLELHLLTNA